MFKLLLVLLEMWGVNSLLWYYIYIYIYIYIYHLQAAQTAQISPPPLSLSLCTNDPSLPTGLPNSILWPPGAVVGKFLLVGQTLAHLCVEVHMDLSRLFQQCPACLFNQNWMVFENGGKWPYGCCVLDCFFILSYYLLHKITG